MPLAGTVCCQTGKRADFAYCLECALNARPAPCIHPYPLIAFMANNQENRKDAGLSVTQLTGCARKVILERDHDYWVAPEKMYALFRGEMTHLLLEKAYGKDLLYAIPEHRVYHQYGDVVLSGKSDLVNLDWGPDHEARISDWKTTWRPVANIDEPKTEHVEQVNFYANLWRRQDHPTWVKSAEVTYINMESYKTVPVEMWESDRAYRLIVERIKPFEIHQQTGVLPDILPSRVVKSRTGITQVTRHPLCGYCVVREICDRYLAEGK